MRYVALLRGINVGGNTMVKMEELRAMFEALSFENVKTYINSGNIAFDSRKSSESSLVSMIEAAIEKMTGKPIQVMVREQNDIARILNSNPFEGQYASHKDMHVLFLKDELPPEKAAQLIESIPAGEKLTVRGREIYCHLPNGVADSYLGRGLFEKKLKISVTARNWRTVEKLVTI